MFLKRGSTDLLKSAHLLPSGSTTVLSPDKVKINYISPQSTSAKYRQDGKSKKQLKRTQKGKNLSNAQDEEANPHKFVPLQPVQIDPNALLKGKTLQKVVLSKRCLNSGPALDRKKKLASSYSHFNNLEGRQTQNNPLASIQNLSDTFNPKRALNEKSPHEPLRNDGQLTKIVHDRAIFSADPKRKTNRRGKSRVQAMPLITTQEAKGSANQLAIHQQVAKGQFDNLAVHPKRLSREDLYSARTGYGKRSNLGIAQHGTISGKKLSLRSDGGNISVAQERADFGDNQSEKTIRFSSELSKVKTLTNLQTVPLSGNHGQARVLPHAGLNHSRNLSRDLKECKLLDTTYDDSNHPTSTFNNAAIFKPSAQLNVAKSGSQQLLRTKSRVAKSSGKTSVAKQDSTSIARRFKGVKMLQQQFSEQKPASAAAKLPSKTLNELQVKQSFIAIQKSIAKQNLKKQSSVEVLEEAKDQATSPMRSEKSLLKQGNEESQIGSQEQTDINEYHLNVNGDYAQTLSGPSEYQLNPLQAGLSDMEVQSKFISESTEEDIRQQAEHEAKIQSEHRKLFPMPIWQQNVQILMPTKPPNRQWSQEKSPFLLAMNFGKLTPFQTMKAYEKTRKLFIQQGINSKSMQAPLKIVKAEQQFKRRAFFGKTKLISQPAQLNINTQNPVNFVEYNKTNSSKVHTENQHSQYQTINYFSPVSESEDITLSLTGSVLQNQQISPRLTQKQKVEKAASTAQVPATSPQIKEQPLAKNVAKIVEKDGRRTQVVSRSEVKNKRKISIDLDGVARSKDKNAEKNDSGRKSIVRRTSTLLQGASTQNSDSLLAVMSKVNFANKWRIGEQVQEDEMEESFINKEILQAKNEFYNPIVMMPNLKTEEKKNSWRPPKRKLKTVIRHRAPAQKENQPAQISPDKEGLRTGSDKKLVNYELIKDSWGNVTIERKLSTTAHRNQNVDEIIHQDPEEMNVSKFLNKKLSFVNDDLEQESCPVQMYKKYCENGPKKDKDQQSKLDKRVAMQVSRCTPEMPDRVTDSQFSSNTRQIHGYTGISTPSLKPIGMMSNKRSNQESIVSTFDERNKNHDIRIKLNQDTAIESMESLEQSDTPANRQD